MRSPRPSFRLAALAGVFALSLFALPTTAAAQAVADTPPALQDLPLQPEDLALYQGTYSGAWEGDVLDVMVWEQNGQLMGQPGMSDPTRLMSQGNHVFVPQADPDVRVTFVIENGRAVGLRFHAGDRVFDGRRNPAAVVTGNAALDLPLTAADIARYVGTYTGELGGRMMWFRVFEQNG